MTQRYATAYVNASLALTETELARMEKWFAKHGTANVRKQDAASRKLVFRLDGGETLVLDFRRKAGLFVSEGSYRLRTLPMADLMRKAVWLFRGDAIVNRIYAHFTMTTMYERGSVVKIIASSGRSQRVLYDYHNLQGRFKEWYGNNRIEREIEEAREAIDALLDRRLRAGGAKEAAAIDRELEIWSRRLFVLEA